MHQQQLAFIRYEGIQGLDCLLVMEFKTAQPMGRDAIMAALRRALTKWAETTAEGREAWEQSSEDYNVGDFLGDCETPEVLRLLADEGILGIEVIYQLSSSEEVSYDALLMHVSD